ncbi:MAG: hypothetical protein WCO72_06635 [Betaproteobacteria bacterium]|jgi:hypothetical protein|nr:hypothetical protein [Polynucleobacter sp.]
MSNLSKKSKLSLVEIKNQVVKVYQVLGFIFIALFLTVSLCGIFLSRINF